MAEAAVSFLLEQVKEVIVTYSDLISKAEEDFKDLNKDLSDLKAILKNIAKNSSDDDVVKETERQLREVVYEVEDTIDSWLTQAAAAKGKPRGTRRAIGKAFGLDSASKISLAKDVKSLREKKVRQMLAKAEKMRREGGIAGDGNAEEQLIIKKD